MSKMTDRIEELRRDAAEDGVPFGEESVASLHALVEAVGGREPDYIWHEDEGHLRVNWRRRPDGASVSIDVCADGQFMIVWIGKHGGGTWRESSIGAVVPTVRSVLDAA